MSRREEGIVVEKSDKGYFVATGKRIVIASENDHIKIGDSISFTSNSIAGDRYAFDIRQCKPIRNSKNYHQNSVLVECKLMGVCSETEMNQRVFRTDFVDKVLENKDWNSLHSNAFIGKTVYIKCNIHPTNAKVPSWEIIEMKDDKNETKSLVGLPYKEKFGTRKTRVYVPGYPEDFILTKSSNVRLSLDKWVKFDIFTKTAKVDDSKPIENHKDVIETKENGMLKLRLTRKNGTLTTEFGENVVDTSKQLENHGITGEFEKKEIWIRILDSFSNKPLFSVSEKQFENESIEMGLPLQAEVRQNVQPSYVQKPLRKPSSQVPHNSTHPQQIYFSPVNPTEVQHPPTQPPVSEPKIIPKNRFQNLRPEDKSKRSKKKTPTTGRPNNFPVARRGQEIYDDPNNLEDYPVSDHYDSSPRDSPPQMRVPNEPRPYNPPRATESRATNSNFNSQMSSSSNDSWHPANSRNSSYNDNSRNPISDFYRNQERPADSFSALQSSFNDIHRRFNQNSQIVSLLQDEMRRPEFNDVMKYRFPEFYDQLMYLLSNV